MIGMTRTINRFRDIQLGMSTDERSERSTPVDEVMVDIRRELVRRVATADRDSNRAIYDALDNE